MFDKLQTFLVLCRTMNYRKTAEELHLTQPAVTKQIQALEHHYGEKLFQYDGHKLHITEKGKILEHYAKSVQYNLSQLEVAMKKERKTMLRIGATKTIGSYVIQERIKEFLRRTNDDLCVVVNNTETLLRMLNDDELDFAFIEGIFEKEKYEYRLLQRVPFVGVCKKGHPFDQRIITLEELFQESLIIRESGSGTRELLERNLNGAGYNLSAFRRITILSSFNLIMGLVKDNIGVSFVYSPVADAYSELGRFQVQNFKTEHEFNVVYLKDTNAKDYVDSFLGL